MNGILNILYVQLWNEYNTNPIRFIMNLYMYFIYYKTLKLIAMVLLLLFYQHTINHSYHFTQSSEYTNICILRTNLNRVFMFIILPYHHYFCCCEFPCFSLMLLSLLLSIWMLLLLCLNCCYNYNTIPLTVGGCTTNLSFFEVGK